MRNRLDGTFYIIVTASFLVPFILLAVFRYTLAVPSIVGELVLSGIFSYAAFWGFSIGKGLSLNVYRRQALWVASAGAFFAGQWLLQAIFDPFYPYGGTGITRLVVDSYNDFGFAVIFGWIDTSIPLLQRSDRFMRLPLKWRQLRLVLWALVIAGAIGGAFQFLGLINDPLFAYLFTTTQYPAIFVGAMALGLGIRRGDDPVLEKHLKWFGRCAIMIIIAFVIGHFSHSVLFLPASGGLYVQASEYVLLTLAGVFLFRSARDLVPLSQIVPEPLIEVPASSRSGH